MQHNINIQLHNRSGIVLLVTLVLLVILSTLAYTISTRLSAQRHRNQYLIDYQIARYACDSAVKYALASLEDIQPQLISRPNEPDFSDLFFLSEIEYQQLLDLSGGQTDQIALQSLSSQTYLSGGQTDPTSRISVRWPDGRDSNDSNDIFDINDINDVNGINDFDAFPDSNTFKPPTIRGPYGPTWPLITETAEFDIGSASVNIKIEDENAKYPLGWAVLDDNEAQREAKASFETFCEWMGINDNADASLGQDVSPRNLVQGELKFISELKTFKLNFQPITRAENAVTRTSDDTSPAARRRRRIITSPSQSVSKTIPVTTQIAEQSAHFAKIFHSSLFEGATAILARPIIISETRNESATKYLGMWGSRTVNINTAPRQVLEAAFIFGGLSEAPKIADEIIRIRRSKPFTDIEDLRQQLLSYSDEITKCEKYITTSSDFFTIKVTATSGVAKTSSVIAVTKTGKIRKRVAVVSL